MASQSGQLHEAVDGMQAAHAGEELAIPMTEFMVRPWLRRVSASLVV